MKAIVAFTHDRNNNACTCNRNVVSLHSERNSVLITVFFNVIFLNMVQLVVLDCM